MKCAMMGAISCPIMDGFTNTQIIGGLLTVLAVSYAAFFGWIVRRLDKFDAKLDGEFRTVYAKLDALTIAVSRLEGAVYHGPPAERREA